MKIKKKIVLIINVAMVLSTIFLIIIALIRKEVSLFSYICVCIALLTNLISDVVLANRFYNFTLWIRTKDRTPTEPEDYFVTIRTLTYNNGQPYTARIAWDDEENAWYNGYGDPLLHGIDDVVAWMPIPDPYMGEE